MAIPIVAVAACYDKSFSSASRRNVNYSELSAIPNYPSLPYRIAGNFRMVQKFRAYREI